MGYERYQTAVSGGSIQELSLDEMDSVSAGGAVAAHIGAIGITAGVACLITGNGPGAAVCLTVGTLALMYDAWSD